MSNVLHELTLLLIEHERFQVLLKEPQSQTWVKVNVVVLKYYFGKSGGSSMNIPE